MKKINVAIVIAIAMLSSCGGNSDKKRSFNPEDRTSTKMSIADRDAAIEAKRASLLPVSLDSLLASHGVSFSVLPTSITESVPKAASDKLATKLIQISSQNGIGGFCTNPVLALVSRVDCIDRSLTGSAPQRAIVKYEVTCYCGNLITNDIYASASQTVTGVGSTFDDAASKAMNEFKNSNEMQKMLSTASERAIKWYSSTANVKKLVDNAVSKQDYGYAMTLLSSVPEQASTTYAYAEKRNVEVSHMYFEDKAAELLGAMEGAIANGGDEYDPQVGAYLQLISPRSGSYTRAKKLYDEYIARMQKVRDDIRDKEHRLAMEELEVEKIKAPYEAQAAIEEIKARASVERAEKSNTGGFLGLGKLWDGSFGLVNRMLDEFKKK